MASSHARRAVSAHMAPIRCHFVAKDAQKVANGAANPLPCGCHGAATQLPGCCYLLPKAANDFR
jgi:hypothetical protein